MRDMKPPRRPTPKCPRCKCPGVIGCSAQPGRPECDEAAKMKAYFGGYAALATAPAETQKPEETA